MSLFASKKPDYMWMMLTRYTPNRSEGNFHSVQQHGGFKITGLLPGRYTMRIYTDVYGWGPGKTELWVEPGFQIVDRDLKNLVLQLTEREKPKPKPKPKPKKAKKKAKKKGT